MSECLRSNFFAAERGYVQVKSFQFKMGPRTNGEK